MNNDRRPLRRFTAQNRQPPERGSDSGFRREVIQRIAQTLRENRFGIEPELTAKVARLPGVRVHERPISYFGRTYADGKKITWRDGLRALWCIVRYGLGG